MEKKKEFNRLYHYFYSCYINRNFFSNKKHKRFIDSFFYLLKEGLIAIKITRKKNINK